MGVGKNLALALASAVLTLLVAEAALRVADFPRTQRSGWRSIARAEELNDLGYRGQRFQAGAAAKIVILLGDSQLEAIDVPFADLPETRLQAHLRRLTGRDDLRVFSLGARGYGTDQEYLALAEYLRGRWADLVVLWETTNNDVWNNMFPTHLPRNGAPKPTFWLDDSGLLQGPVFPPGARVPAFKLAALYEAHVPPDQDGDWARRHLPPPYQPEAACADAASGLEGQEDLLRMEKSPYGVLLHPRSPRARYGAALTNALYRRTAALCASSGTRFAVFSTTSMPSTSSEHLHRVGTACYRLSQAALRENMLDMHREVSFFSVPVALPEAAILGRDHGHYNAIGNDHVMGNLALEILKRSLL